jgi:hypothetical protein
MISQTKRLGKGYWLMMLSAFLLISCSKNEDSPEVPEKNLEEELETVNNDEENTVTMNGNIYTLSYGDGSRVSR